MRPTPRLSPSLVVLALMLISPVALAQNGVCKAGTKCTSSGFLAQTSAIAQCATLLTQPGYSYGWGHSTSSATFGAFSGNTCSGGFVTTVGRINLNLNTDIISLSNRAATGDGAVGTPSWTFINDLNTGFWGPGSDRIEVVTGGVRSFRFSATAGVLEGDNSGVTLTMNSTTGAQLSAGSALLLAAGDVVLTPASNGSTRWGGAIVPTSFSTNPRSLNWDTASRPWVSTKNPAAGSPIFDVGGEPHPVLQQHMWGIDMGIESSATPTFYPVAPRVGGSAATITVTDAAAAGSASLGASPNIVEARSFVTTAAAGSRSFFSTTAFIRKTGHAPRWCQKMSMSTTSNIRVWAGIVNADPGANDNPANGAVTFRYSTSAGDSKWMWCYANGVSTTCAASAVTPASGTGSFDTLCIDCREGLTTACVWWINGAAIARQTTGLPAGTPFWPHYSVEARSAAAVTGYAGPVSVEMN